ncbi:unnamed protein product, partial [Polarella glacialis]
GPLFESLLAEAPIGQPPSSTSSELLMAKKAAATTGCYSIAVLSYVSVCVLQEYRKKPTEGQAAEDRLLKRARTAKAQNPFVSEFLAFAPAFELVFPEACDLPPASHAASPEELAMLEALEYCCRSGGRGQVAVWLDTDDEVRRFLRETLYEEDLVEKGEQAADKAALAAASGGAAEAAEEEPPPFTPLPPPAANEPP